MAGARIFRTSRRRTDSADGAQRRRGDRLRGVWLVDRTRTDGCSGPCVDHAQHVPERAERRAGSRDHWGDGGTGRPRRPCGGGPPPLARVDPAGTGGMESPAAASRASGVSIRSREVASSGMGGGDCWRVVASGRGLGGGDGCSPVSGVVGLRGDGQPDRCRTAAGRDPGQQHRGYPGRGRDPGGGAMPRYRHGCERQARRTRSCGGWTATRSGGKSAASAFRRARAPTGQ